MHAGEDQLKSRRSVLLCGQTGWVVLICGLLGVSTSCTSSRPIDLNNPDQSIDARLDVVGPIQPDDPARWDTLTRTAWSANEPVRLRITLLDRLHTADPEQFWGDAAVRLQAERSSEVAVPFG